MRLTITCATARMPSSPSLRASPQTVAASKRTSSSLSTRGCSVEIVVPAGSAGTNPMIAVHRSPRRRAHLDEREVHRRGGNQNAARAQGVQRMFDRVRLNARREIFLFGRESPIQRAAILVSIARGASERAVVEKIRLVWVPLAARADTWRFYLLTRREWGAALANASQNACVFRFSVRTARSTWVDKHCSLRLV